MQMPTAVQIQNIFGADGPLRATSSTLASLRDQERRGRVMREVQIKDMCTVQCDVTASFSSTSSTGAVVNEWLDFGRVRFLDRPVCVCGSSRMAQAGETPLLPDLSNFALTTHETVPCAAMAIGWRQDQQGRYTGAKVALFALDAVTAGYQANIGIIFMGRAVRMA